MNREAVSMPYQGQCKKNILHHCGVSCWLLASRSMARGEDEAAEEARGGQGGRKRKKGAAGRAGQRGGIHGFFVRRAVDLTRTHWSVRTSPLPLLP